MRLLCVGAYCFLALFILFHPKSSATFGKMDHSYICKMPSAKVIWMGTFHGYMFIIFKHGFLQ